MAEYTLKYINHRAEHDAEAFVHDCEEALSSSAASGG